MDRYEQIEINHQNAAIHAHRDIYIYMVTPAKMCVCVYVYVCMHACMHVCKCPHFSRTTGGVFIRTQGDGPFDVTSG